MHNLRRRSLTWKWWYCWEWLKRSVENEWVVFILNKKSMAFTLVTINAFWKSLSAMAWISLVILDGAKYWRRAIVTVWEPSTMQRFTLKTTFLGPFCGSIGQGDSKTMTPAIVTEPGELTFMLRGREGECLGWCQLQGFFKCYVNQRHHYDTLLIQNETEGFPGWSRVCYIVNLREFQGTRHLQFSYDR